MDTSQQVTDEPVARRRKERMLSAALWHFGLHSARIVRIHLLRSCTGDHVNSIRSICTILLVYVFGLLCELGAPYDHAWVCGPGWMYVFLVCRGGTQR
jgi:hypothetical protein